MCLQIDVCLLFLSAIHLPSTVPDLTDCNEPPPVANAYRTISNTSVEYRCIDNYVLTSGNLTRTCLDGELTGTPPVCEVSCGAVLTSGYANTSVHGKGGDATVTYTCSEDSVEITTTAHCDTTTKFYNYWKKGDLCFSNSSLNMSTFSAVQTSTLTINISDTTLNDTAFYGANNAIDDNSGTNLMSGACSSTGLEQRPHIKITLDGLYSIYQIVVTLPDNSSGEAPLPNLHIKVARTQSSWQECFIHTDDLPQGVPINATCKQRRYPPTGKHIKLETDFDTGTGKLQICNVEIYARPVSSVDCGQPFEQPYAIMLNQPSSTNYTDGTVKVSYACIDGYSVKTGKEDGHCNIFGYWTADLVCTADENLSYGKNVWQTTNRSQLLPSLSDFNSSSCINVSDVTEAMFVIDLEEDIEISDVSVRFGDVTTLKTPTINITVWRGNQTGISCDVVKLEHYKGDIRNVACKHRPVTNNVGVHVSYKEAASLELCELIVHGRRFDDALECYHHETQSDYKGKMNMTVTGIPCQRWDLQTPHPHNHTDVTKFPDGSLSDAANYCRNPDGKKRLWCYTTNPNVTWQFCPVENCDYMCLRDTKGLEYKGNLKKTASGDSCIRWKNKKIPFKKKSHFFGQWPGRRCRNPLTSQSRPWCYTKATTKEYGLCSIPACPKSPDLIWGHWVMDTDQTLSDLIPSQECLVWNGNYSTTAGKAFRPDQYREKFIMSQVCSTGRVYNATVLCSNMSESGTVWRTGILECVHCGPPPSVNNTRLNTSSGYLGGFTIYTCVSGYRWISGSERITCLRNGQWETPDIICHVNCGIPPSVSNTNVETVNTTLNSTAIYTCDSGYSHVAGKSSTTCTEAGDWETPTIECIADRGTPPSMNNAHAVTVNTTVNSTAVYTCDPGYSHVTGSKYVMCRETGDWEEPKIRCIVTVHPSPATWPQTTSSAPVRNIADKYKRCRYKSCICRCIQKRQAQEDAIKEMLRKLQMNTKALVSYKTRKESRPDARQTSHGMAFIAMCLVAVMFGTVFVSDVYSLVAGIRRHVQKIQKTDPEK